jgi:hypothetical protein
LLAAAGRTGIAVKARLSRAGRVFARKLTAWQDYSIWIIAGVHGQQHDGTPKMPGEPPRVQPSKKVAANWDDEGNPRKKP